MMKNLGLGLVLMVVGLSGVFACAQSPDNSGSRIQVTCPNGNTCQGTLDVCVSTCSDSSSTQTIEQGLTSAPDLNDVTVTCSCGGSCTGSSTECADFCNQTCGGGGSGEILN